MVKQFTTGSIAVLMSFPALAGMIYHWNGPSDADRSGAWEAASNWVVNGVPATSYPGENATDDHAYFTNGTYTVTLASDKTLAVVERSKKNEDGAAVDYGTCTLDLNGHTLTASQRIDCSIRTYQFQGGHPGHGSTLVFTNGEVRCDAEVETASNGSDNAYATASGVGIGLPWAGWSDRIRGVLNFRGVTAVFNQVMVNSSQGGIRIEDGATFTATGRFTVNGSASKNNGRALVVRGEGTTFTADHIYCAGHIGVTNLFENRSVANIGYLVTGVDQSEQDDGGYYVVHSGATLNITSQQSNRAIYCHQSRVARQHFIATGEGTTVNVTYEGTSKGQPSIGIGSVESSPYQHTFEVSDGAVFTAGAKSVMLIGSDTGDKMLTVDDATLSVGYLMCGTTYWYKEDGINKLGLGSNNTVRVSGRRAKLEVKGEGSYSNGASGGEGAMNLNFNALLEISVPQEGFAETPIQVTDAKLCTKSPTISAYADNPGCRMMIHAKDWIKKHKGEEQPLISTAQDSTLAFAVMTNHVTFGDIEDETLRPTFRIDKNGTATSLVLIAPPERGLGIMLK
ncbi:MAG TPA: hypothetical protein PK251_15180 [Candidatus Latescibacteria bacterium]|nr:hypothetical protein [Candidatus Latescibacterota bacterium]